MRLMNHNLPIGAGKNPLMALLIFAGLLIMAYEAAGFIITGDTAGLVYFGLVFVVVAVAITILNSWERGVYLFLCWLMFEDFFRKYLGNNMAIYFAKDVLALVVYLSLFLAWRRKQITGFRPPFLVPLLLMVWLGILQIFNPTSPHIIYGLLGVKIFFYYVPMMMVGYALVTTEQRLRTFLVVNIVLFLAIAALGIAQSIIGPTFLNPATLQEEIRDLSTLYRLAPISGALVYRPTSVFVSTGRYSDLLIIAWIVSLGFLGYTLLHYKRGRRLAFLAVPFLVAGILLSASRGVFAWAIINLVAISAAFLWGAPWRQREVMRVLRAFTRIALGGALAVFVLLAIFPEALGGRLAVYSETLSPDSPTSELLHRTRDYPLQNFLGAFNYERWPYGYGIGTTAAGVQYVTRIIGVKPLGVGVESGFGGLIVEMGILGLVLWLVMGTAILFSAWRIIRKLRGSPWFPVGFAFFWYAALMFFPMMVGGLQAYEDFLMNAYLWLSLGILFQLPNVKLSAELEAAELAASQSRRRWIT